MSFQWLSLLYVPVKDGTKSLWALYLRRRQLGAFGVVRYQRVYRDPGENWGGKQAFRSIYLSSLAEMRFTRTSRCETDASTPPVR